MRTFAGATARDDDLVVDDPHLMRRYALRGIHRRWHPVMRWDVRGGLWLCAVVVIAEVVDAADTTLMGIARAWAMGPRCRDRLARGYVRSPPPRALRWGRPIVLHGCSAPLRWGHARAPRRGGRGREEQADAAHGTGEQAWGRWRPGQMLQTVRLGGAQLPGSAGQTPTKFP
jgi:hypothetical protein